MNKETALPHQISTLLMPFSYTRIQSCHKWLPVVCKSLSPRYFILEAQVD